MAAYYNPKRISSDTSSEHAFWTAVTNIYALFTDCAGYIQDGLLNLLCKNNLLKSSDKKKINYFIRLIKYTRSLFCHNMSFELGETEKQLGKFNMFLNEQLQHEIPGVSIPYKTELSSEDWDKLTSYLAFEFQSCIGILGKSIDKIATLNEKSKSYIVDEWLKLIADWYGRFFYFQKVANDYFELSCHLGNKMDKNEWIKEQKKNWKNNKKTYVKKMKERKEPAFPDKILTRFFFDQMHK